MADNIWGNDPAVPAVPIPTFPQQLADPTLPGASLVGFDGIDLASWIDLRVAKVVLTLAELRTVDKTKYSQVLLVGYATAGDVPLRHFYLKSSGTENGITTIVAADGGIWGWTPPAEGIDIRFFGVDISGASITTAQVQTAFNFCASSSTPLYGGQGTAVVHEVEMPSGLIFNGGNAFTFKRPASAAAGRVLYASGANGIRLSGFIVDGNKASNTNGGTNISIESGCFDIQLDTVISKNAKIASGYGAGFSISNTADVSNSTRSVLKDCVATACDADGLYIDAAYYINVIGGSYSQNDGGVTAINYVFPPVADVTVYVRVTGTDCLNNTKTGIKFVGFYSGGTTSAPIYGNATQPNRAVIIEKNNAIGNGQYGIVFQGIGGLLDNNVVRRNGTLSSDGGILCNAIASQVSRNYVDDNALYGIDIGGSEAVSVTHNTVTNQGATSGLGANAINCGGTLDCLVESNQLYKNGGAGQSSIYASGFEFGGAWFDQLAKGLAIKNNKIRLSTTSAYGVVITNGADEITLDGNEVRGAALGNAFVLQGGKSDAFNFRETGNVDWANSGNQPVLSSTAALVIPDIGSGFFVTGTTNITSINTNSSSVLSGKLRYVEITAGGSGYDPAMPPTVSFSGGGGSGAAGSVLVSNSGAIIGVKITNLGSGYTSAPTVTFSSGAATASAHIGCNNFTNRTITLFITGSLTVVNGNNLALTADFVTASGNGVLVLQGAFGKWYEVSRRL